MVNKMKKLIKIIIVILLIFTNSCLSALKVKKSNIYLVDADTIKLRLNNNTMVKVRLIGIDTPEKFKTKKFYKDIKKCKIEPEKLEMMGKLSSKYLMDLINNGNKFEIKIFGIGYYNRYLGILYINNEEINKILLRNGYACFRYSTLIKNNNDYLNNMIIAIKNKKGLWKKFHNEMMCLCF